MTLRRKCAYKHERAGHCKSTSITSVECICNMVVCDVRLQPSPALLPDPFQDMSDKNAYREYSSKPTADIDTVPFYLYAVEGSFLSAISLALVLLIIATSKLRCQKEFQIFILCIAFDAIFGVAYFSAGLYRLQLVKAYAFVPLKSRWECINMLHNHVFVFITPGAGILALITSIDRFISVFFPLKYIKIPADRYFLILVTTLIAATTPTTVLSYVYSYELGPERDVNAMCLLVQGVPSEMFMALRAIRIICTIMAVLLYVPIAIRMYYVIKRSAAFNIKVGQASKLRRMTVTVSLITVSQLVLFTFPDTILFFVPDLQSMAFYVMNLNKGILNVLIFFITQRDLRKALLQQISSFFGKKCFRNIVELEVSSIQNADSSTRRTPTRPKTAVVATITRHH
uniref:G_PROTEIN_RECEP_F1_2 domain-containing protein n=1 Tax=Steinernema glaseri TaxID=37863 RepID=A0A1I7YIT9_9BILA